MLLCALLVDGSKYRAIHLSLFATLGTDVSDSVYRIIALFVSVVLGAGSKHYSSMAWIWCRGIAMVHGHGGK